MKGLQEQTQQLNDTTEKPENKGNSIFDSISCGIVVVLSILILHYNMYYFAL